MIGNDVYLGANTFCGCFSHYKKKTQHSRIKNYIPGKKKNLRSIHTQETNFHNSIKIFTIRVTVSHKGLYSNQDCLLSGIQNTRVDPTFSNGHAYIQRNSYTTIFTLYISNTLHFHNKNKTYRHTTLCKTRHNRQRKIPLWPRIIYEKISNSMIYGGKQRFCCRLSLSVRTKTTMTRQCAKHLY
jgi:hypothetical protein